MRQRCGVRDNTPGRGEVHDSSPKLLASLPSEEEDLAVFGSSEEKRFPSEQVMLSLVHGRASAGARRR